MVQVAGFSSSFSAGELGPDGWERTELAQHAQGCALALNCIGLASGPNVSRGGTVRAGAPKYQDKKRRYVPFARPDGEGLVLEFGHLYARVWSARGAKVMNGGSQVEFAHGYVETELDDLRFLQVGDVTIITHRLSQHPTYIERLDDLTWVFGFYDFLYGPWLPENIDDAKTLTITQISGILHLIVASQPTFSALHVGASFRILSPSGAPGLPSWSPYTTVAVGAQWISDGRIYLATAGGPKTGNTPPVHERGTCNDGVVDWQFLHDGATVVKITAVISNTQVQCEILNYIPVNYGVPTSHWAEGAYSDLRGYPSALAAVSQERLVLGGANGSPSFVDMSRTSGFTPTYADFKPGLGTGMVVDDDAVRLSLGSHRARVIWLLSSTSLLAGTSREEYVITGGTVDDPIAPAGATPRPLSSYGSADVMPVLVQGPPARVLHMARGAITLRELTISPDTGTEGRDLSILAQHIFGLGVKEMAWQQPDNNLWLRLSDGSLAVLTYHIEHGVLGARRQALGGGWTLESLCVAPDDLGKDRVHLAALRTVGGTVQRQHLVVALRSENIWTDCTVQYEGGAISSLGGFSWAEGETLNVVSDGAASQAVVAGGVVNFPPGSSVQIGYPMLRRQVSLPLDLGGPGSMLAKQSRITQCLVVLGCVTAEVGCEGMDDPEPVQPFETVDSRRPDDGAPVLRRKRAKVHVAQGTDRDNRVVVQTSAPYDLQIYALHPIAGTNP